MSKQLIRPACSDDAKALSLVKSRYVRALYRGFLSADYLNSLDESFFEEQMSAWVAGQYQVKVLEQDQEVVGFVVYGTDPEDANYGLIHEVGVLPAGSWQEKDLLMQTCLDDLAQQYELVRARTVRDNFRSRFLFEQFGFREDGAQCSHTVAGNELRIIRLVGRTRRKEA